MKNSRRKVLASLILTMIFVLNMNTKAVADSGLQLSMDKELYHIHNDTDCKERRWIACGGQWCTNFEPSVGATVYYCSNNQSSKVVNGVRLSSIHSGWHTDKKSGTHSGEYRSVLICTNDTTSSIGNVHLELYNNGKINVSTDQDYLTIENISLSNGLSGTDITLDSVGSYTATVSVTDTRYNTTDTITFDFEFVDNINPIILDVYTESERNKHNNVVVNTDDNVGVTNYKIVKEVE